MHVLTTSLETMIKTQRKRRRALRIGFLLALCASAGACRTVEFYDLQRYSDPVMDMAEGEAQTHFQRKIFYSMEGAAGGLGGGAGGGCGCY